MIGIARFWETLKATGLASPTLETALGIAQGEARTQANFQPARFAAALQQVEVALETLKQGKRRAAGGEEGVTRVSDEAEELPRALTILELPESDRPREKLAAQGAAALWDAELLAILLRTGIQGTSALEMGRGLLARYQSLAALARCSVPELAKIRGMGLAKAVQLAAAFGLASRLARESFVRQKIDSPRARLRAPRPRDADAPKGIAARRPARYEVPAPARGAHLARHA